MPATGEPKDPKAWVMIGLNSPELEAWEKYWTWQDWQPWMLRQLRLKAIEHIAVPAQWPEWFDLDYHPLPEPMV